jgi:hypothetical protein
MVRRTQAGSHSVSLGKCTSIPLAPIQGDTGQLAGSRQTGQEAMDQWCQASLACRLRSVSLGIPEADEANPCSG